MNWMWVIAMVKSGFVVGCLLFWVCSSSANDELNQQAAKFYAEQNWSEAVNAYSQLVKDQPANEQAWYRIAHAHIQLKQGQQALTANQKLANAQQIPASMVLYQKAQALTLTDNQAAVWEALKQAASSGFRNLNDLNTNALWTAYREDQRFAALQQQVDKNIRPCMHEAVYRQFDFWLGRWEVYGNLDKTGPLFGHNTISQSEQGCLIMEQWQGASGSTGTSMNYYDGLKQQWVQRWVSGGGTVIDYAGGLIHTADEQQAMQLVGKIYYASTQQQPQIRDFRGTWTSLKDGVVQQFFEESVDGGKTWYAWFNGYYFPMTEVVEK